MALFLMLQESTRDTSHQVPDCRREKSEHGTSFKAAPWNPHTHLLLIQFVKLTVGHGNTVMSLKNWVFNWAANWEGHQQSKRQLITEVPLEENMVTNRVNGLTREKTPQGKRKLLLKIWAGLQERKSQRHHQEATVRLIRLLRLNTYNQSKF